MFVENLPRFPGVDPQEDLTELGGHEQRDIVRLRLLGRYKIIHPYAHQHLPVHQTAPP